VELGVWAWVLRLGADAQVLAPPELVTHLGTTIRAMARLYPYSRK
jgi:hypothetical protein